MRFMVWNHFKIIPRSSSQKGCVSEKLVSIDSHDKSKLNAIFNEFPIINKRIIVPQMKNLK